MGSEKQTNSGEGDVENATAKPPKVWIQQRYIVAIMGALCIMMQYILKVNLSVGIVAMVKPPASHSSEEKSEMSEVVKTKEGEGEFDWDIEMQGHILSSYYYGYVATQFFGGYAADRWGGKVVVGPGIALTGLLTLFCPIAARNGGPWAFFVVRILEGLCSGVILPGMHYMFSVWFPPQERTSFSGAVFSLCILVIGLALHCGTVIGMAASGPLSNWPLEGGGWPMVFYFFGAIGVALIIPWWLLVYDDPESNPRISPEEKAFIQLGLGKEEKAKELQKAAPVPWKYILTDIHVWTGIIFHWGTGWVLYTMLSDLPTYMKNVLHFDINKLSFLSALPSLLTWISSIISGILSQWLRRKKYLSHIAAYKVFNGVAAMGPTACLIGIALVGYNPDVIVTLLAINGFASGAIFGGSYVNHMDLAVNFAGVISGILHTILNSSGIVLPIVIAEIVKGKQTVEQWSIVFYMGAGISAVTYILYLIFGSVQECPWNKLQDLKATNEKNETQMENGLSVIGT